MAKRAEAEGRVVEKKTIQSFCEDPEMEIIRETLSDGSIIYRHPIGDVVLTSEEHWSDVVGRPLNRIDALAGLLGDDCWEKFGFVAEAVTRDARLQYAELLDLLARDAGISVVVDVVHSGQFPYRAGRIVGVRIERIAEKQGVPE